MFWTHAFRRALGCFRKRLKQNCLQVSRCPAGLPQGAKPAAQPLAASPEAQPQDATLQQEDPSSAQ
eukprot:3269181-Amphidinium_carterae.1